MLCIATVPTKQLLHPQIHTGQHIADSFRSEFRIVMGQNKICYDMNFMLNYFYLNFLLLNINIILAFFSFKLTNNINPF